MTPGQQEGKRVHARPAGTRDQVSADGAEHVLGADGLCRRSAPASPEGIIAFHSPIRSTRAASAPASPVRGRESILRSLRAVGRGGKSHEAWIRGRVRGTPEP
jgi:hypothetical protein